MSRRSRAEERDRVRKPCMLALLTLGLSMRLVLQRCKSASVTVGGSVVSSIGGGIVALCGLHVEDTDADL